MLNRLRESISAFANAPLPVERWSAPPSDSPSPYSDFISSLQMINMGPSRPCTLIHELGQHVDNSVSDVLRNLFTPGQHVYVLTSSIRASLESSCYVACMSTHSALEKPVLSSKAFVVAGVFTFLAHWTLTVLALLTCRCASTWTCRELGRDL